MVTDVTTRPGTPATHILRDPARSILRASRWSRFRFAAAGATVAACLALLAGCGGGGDELSAADRVEVAGFNADVASTVLDGSGYGALLDSLDTVTALAREKPDAEYEGRTLRQVLADAASDLQPYQPDLAAEIDRTVETLD